MLGLSLGMMRGRRPSTVIIALLQLPHRTWFTKGKFGAFAFQFGAHGQPGLEEGTDYDGKWSIDKRSFPAGSVLDWKVPLGAIPNGLGVWGYNAISAYNYDGSIQQIQAAPRQVCDLTAFGTEFNWSYSGSGHFGLLHELWLNNRPSQTEGNSNNPTTCAEIGFFFRQDNYSFHNSGIAIGPGYSDNGVLYTVRKNGAFITFAPATEMDLLAGRINWKSAFDYLMRWGAITGLEWVSGVAIGVEPGVQAGSGGTHSGRMTLNHFALTDDLIGTANVGIAGYLGNNLAPALDGWSGSEMTKVAGQADIGGATTAIWMQEAATTGAHEVLAPGAWMPVPSRQMDLTFTYAWKNDRGRDVTQLNLAVPGWGSQLYSWFNAATMETATQAAIGSDLVLRERQIIAVGGGWFISVVRFRKAAGISSIFTSIMSHDGAGTSFLGDAAKGFTLSPSRVGLFAGHGVSLSGAAPAGMTGSAYTYTPTIVGGQDPLAFSISSGALPAGLSLDANTGTISGTPTSGGTAPVTLRVISADGITSADLALSLAITATAAPTNSVAPSITNPSIQPDFVVQGQQLTCTTGTWAGTPVPTYTYQWRRNGVTISGATLSTYTVQAADDGAVLTCAVTATNAAGSETAATATGPTAIAGSIIVSDTFANQGGWNNSQGVSWSGGQMVFTNVPAYSGSGRSASLTAGRSYRIIYTIVSMGTGQVLPNFNGGTRKDGTARTSAGTFNDVVAAVAGNTGLGFMTYAVSTATFDNLLVIELP